LLSPRDVFISVEQRRPAIDSHAWAILREVIDLIQQNAKGADLGPVLETIENALRQAKMIEAGGEWGRRRGLCRRPRLAASDDPQWRLAWFNYECSCAFECGTAGRSLWPPAAPFWPLGFKCTRGRHITAAYRRGFC
jgi:hypothetical protein